MARMKGEPPLASEPAPPPEPVYPCRFTMQTTVAWGSTIDMDLSRSTLRKLLRGELPFLRITDGDHPQGQARYIAFGAITEISIMRGWDEPTPGEE